MRIRRNQELFQSHRTSHIAVRSTTRELGFEASWPNMLTYQDTSPCGLGSTFRFLWRHGIQGFLGAGMSPSCLAGRYAGKRVTLANWGSHQMFLALIQRFQCFSTTQRGTASNSDSGPSLSPTLWQVATHAPKGPRTHAMSPPWRG